MRKIVIASDSFKGSLSSLEVALAAAAGVEAAAEGEDHGKAGGVGQNEDGRKRYEVRCIEVADGGEGTAATLTRALGGETGKAVVSDPLGRKTEATYGIATYDGRKTAVMEMSQASGLTLLNPSERNPLLTSTYGTGEMILDALDRGCRRFLIGIGGSATNDGGTGMLEALGFRFIDKEGREMTGLCGGNIGKVSRIIPPALLKEAEFIIACDVETQFCGREGATAVFGPQKGATPEGIAVLEEGMQNLNKIIIEETGIDLSTIKGSGAAGGIGGAFHALLGGRLQSGTDMVLEAIGFEEDIKDADLIITGEGRIDSQTGRGKVISGITAIAAKHGIPVIAIAGMVDMSEDEIKKAGLKAAFPIGPRPQNESDLEYAMRPEVASKNISDTVAKALVSLFPSSFRESL